MKAKFTAILLSLLSVLAGNAFAYADGAGQPPYIEPTEETADSSVECTDEPTVNPYEELYLQQTESNEEMSGLLLDIKDLISGLKSGMEVTSIPVSTPIYAPVSVPEAVQMTSEQTPDTIPEPAPEPEPTEIPKVTETNGNGYIVEDMQQLNGGMEFLTMASKDGSVFYMVIDRNKDNEVYLLNKVDTADLEGFVEETPMPEETASPSPSPTPIVEPSETPSAEQQESTDTKKSGNSSVLIILLLAAASGGAVYWFKFRNNGSGGADNDDNAVDSEFETDDEAYLDLNGNEINEDEAEGTVE